MGKTTIEWCDAAWPVVTGCTRVSEGCRNCYSERLTATRLKNLPAYKGLAEMKHGDPRWTGEVRLNEKVLQDPLHWKTPRRIFVSQMSDLFHESVPDEFIDRVFAVMALCPQHSFQILTKRPKRMAEYCARLYGNAKQRDSSLSSGRDRRIGDKDGRDDLAAQESICEQKSQNSPYSMRTAPGRGRSEAAFFLIPSDICRIFRYPFSLAALQWSDPGRDDDQSQKRDNQRQQAGESRAGHATGTEPARLLRTETSSGGATGRSEFEDSPHGSSRDSNQTEGSGRRESSDNRQRFQNQQGRSIPNRHDALMVACRVGPLPNVWLGCSVEDQETADERIPLLLQTPAAVRFVSYEPALGRIEIRKWFCCDRGETSGHLHLPSIDWLICGGESGPNARPMEEEWARSVMEQCKAAGVAFFMKQGSKANWPDFKNLESFPEDLRVREYPS